MAVVCDYDHSELQHVKRKKNKTDRSGSWFFAVGGNSALVWNRRKLPLDSWNVCCNGSNDNFVKIRLPDKMEKCCLHVCEGIHAC